MADDHQEQRKPRMAAPFGRAKPSSRRRSPKVRKVALIASGTDVAEQVPVVLTDIELRRKVMELFEQGHPYDEIGGKVGKSSTEVRDLVAEVLQDYVVTPELAVRLKARQLLMLQAVQREASRTMFEGRLSELGLKAADRLLKSLKQESELCGLDAPVRASMQLVPVDPIDAELAEMLTEARAHVDAVEAELNEDG